MDPKGAQMEPKNQQIELQGAAESEKPIKLPSKGGTMEPQVLQWSPKTPQTTRKRKKGLQRANKARICAASAEKHTSTRGP